MKALSVRQPYADLILTKRKEIELRSWRCEYRGYMLLHASKSPDRAECDRLGLWPQDDHYGALLCELMLADIIPIRSEARWDKWRKWHLDPGPFPGPCFAWFVEPRTVFARPIPWRGRLGLFEVPNSAIEQEIPI